jgi:hypothetical protein
MWLVYKECYRLLNKVMIETVFHYFFLGKRQ